MKFAIMFATFLSWVKEYGGWVLSMIKEHGKKTVLILLLAAAIIGTTWYVVDYKIKQVVPETIEYQIEQQSEEHAIKLIESQDMYIAVKQKIRSTMRETGCQYIYLIEYHNGSENMASTFPFYKFDVTMDICQEGVPFIDTSPLKDEHIFKYDIFDNPEFTQQQFAYCNREDFKTVDPKLYHMMESNEDVEWIYTFNLYYKGRLMGAVLALSYEQLDVKTFVNCMHEIENIFNGKSDNK